MDIVAIDTLQMQKKCYKQENNLLSYF